MKKRISENTKITLTIKQLKKLVKESRKKRLERYEVVLNKLDDDDSIIDTIYEEMFDDKDEAMDKGEELTEKYKNRKGNFEIRVEGGIYEDEDGEEDTTDMYSVLYMTSGPEGYQGLVNMA